MSLEIDILYIDKKITESDLIPDKEFYYLDTLDILEEYKKVLRTPIKIDFFSINSESIQKDTQDVLEKKNELISRYLEILKKLSYLQYLESIDMTYLCAENKTDHWNKAVWRCDNVNGCDSQLFAESKEVEGLTICLECGHQNEFLKSNSVTSHNDSKRASVCSKYSYDKKSHFINCCNQFQGKSKSADNKEMKTAIEKIKTELIRYNIVPNVETEMNVQNEQNFFSQVTKEHVSIFVKELKLTKYYGDINLIHHKITGVPLHNISHLMDKLLIDFDQFVKQHNKHYPMESDNKNFNYQLLLYQLLMRHKYKCNPNEFNFLKTTERKVYHDGRCRLLFMELGWNYTDVF